MSSTVGTDAQRDGERHRAPTPGAPASIDAEALARHFAELIEQPGPERDARLRALHERDPAIARELRSLLDAADAASGFLSTPIGGETTDASSGRVSTRADDDEPNAPDTNGHEDLRGRRLGPWHLLHELGRGGMGSVHLAERADGHYRQHVALKIAHRRFGDGPWLARFHAERQALADLHHPGIATLLDGGNDAEGRPYLVMEHLPGRPIDRHCRETRADIDTVLTLFGTVCEAVEHAHRNLVVHCDIKPGNIVVVDTGAPVLLDFGVAHLLRDDPASFRRDAAVGPTATAATPAYAAPEQLAGEVVTTATDIYALGRVLATLLDDERPGRTPRRRDLDDIVAKALAPRPGDRYRSVHELHADVCRYREGRAVTAATATPRYLATRFLGRHRRLAALVAVTTVAFATACLLGAWQWRVAATERTLAEERLQEVRRLADALVFALPETIAELPGTLRARERLLEGAIAYLDRLAALPEPEPELARALADGYHRLAMVQGNPMHANLGTPQRALANAEKSIALREALLEHHPEELDLALELALDYIWVSGIHGGVLGDAAGARRFNERALALLERFAGMPHPELRRRRLSALTLAAHWSNADGETSRAEGFVREAEDYWTRVVRGTPLATSAEGHRLKARIHEERAEIAAASGHAQAALAHERARLARIEELAATRATPSRLTGAAWHALAARLAASGRLTEALRHYRRSLDEWRRWRRRHPEDVGAAQAIAVIETETADTYWTLAAEPDGDAVETRGHACRLYRSAREALRSLAGDGREIPNRYRWSPSADEIDRRASERCASRS